MLGKITCLFVMSGMITIVMTAAIRGGDDKTINKFLDDKELVSKQILCVLEKATCDQLGRQLKAALPEVILRNCRNCSPRQAQNAQKLTNFLQTRHPGVWAMIVQKYRGANGKGRTTT